MTTPKYLLIIDTMPLERHFINYFEQFGFKILQKASIEGIGKEWSRYAALLINCSLLQNDDLGAMNQWYQQHPIPMIIISNTLNEEICVHMLENGADDFMVKPLHPRELHARISAISRRLKQCNQREDHGKKEILSFATWHLYPTSRQLFSGDTEQLLSPNEFDLLLAFVRRPQQILDREFLAQAIHSSVSHPLDRRIDVQISRLRQKIERDDKKPELIKTIRNRGYMLTTKVVSSKE